MKIRLEFDPNDLTLGDMEDFEAATGEPFGALAQRFRGKPANEVIATLPAKALTALVWIVARRADPDFTLAMARDTKATDIEAVRPLSGAAGAKRGSNGSRSSRASTESRRRLSGV
jgi:hypothetical protein